MTIQLGIVMDPITGINVKKDSSLAMLIAAQQRGWSLFYMEQQDLLLHDNTAMANMQSIHIDLNKPNWYSLGEKQLKRLDELDVLLMRKDPPVDSRYIFTTYFLESAQKAGVLVVNNPQSLRDHNEKLFALNFADCCVPTLVSSNNSELKNFLAEHNEIIFKPLDEMGGRNVFKVDKKNPNINVIIENLTQYGSLPIIAQRYIPEITQGDKRILCINGEPVSHALARVPQAEDPRGNLAAGGTGVAQPLSKRDYWICEQIAPTLKAKGLIFVGIDVIGDYLTEINITSPTCIRELDAQCNLDIAGDLMSAIESLL